MKEFWNRPVKIGFFVKLFIVLNFTFLWWCMRIAYIGDLKDEKEQEYYQYLESCVELQSQVIDVQHELLNEYRK